MSAPTAQERDEEHTAWLIQLDAARALLQEIKTSVSTSGRTRGSPQAASGAETDLNRTRVTALCRRKLNTLKTSIDALQALVEREESTECSPLLSEHEKNRRRNDILSLRQERDTLVRRVSITSPVLVSTSEQTRGQMPAPTPTPRETDATAVRSNAQLLEMQQALMHDQDEALDYLERSVGTTKRIALGIHDETELQNRLLEDFDEEVGLTADRVYNVRKRVARYLERQGCCGSTGVGMLFVVVVVLTIVLILLAKVL
jgi:hypothetical protein